MIQPFTIHVPQFVLDGLSDRLACTRWLTRVVEDVIKTGL
jgi:hypothetical protein